MYDPSNDPDFLHSVLASSGDCIKVLDLKGNLVFMTEEGRRVMEVSDFNAIRGCPWPDFWQDKGNEDAKAAIAAALAGEVGRFQGQASTMAGTIKYWDVQVTPIRGPSGEPDKLLSVSRDITALKEAQDRQALLHEELAHRVKNTLAMVQAIAAQTIRGDVTLEQARDAFTSRLLALAKANDVLMKASWTEVSLTSLVEASAQVLSNGPGRFNLDGPDVRIGPKAALSFALALHELGTNALKYGALSTEHGRVDLTWRLSEGGSPHLTFVWAERDGPVVEPPVRKGFGSRLIDRMLAANLGAEVSMDYAPTGVKLTVDGPVAAMQAN